MGWWWQKFRGWQVRQIYNTGKKPFGIVAVAAATKQKQQYINKYI